MQEQLAQTGGSLSKPAASLILTFYALCMELSVVADVSMYT